MEASKFTQYINQYLGGIVLKRVETINNETMPLRYLHLDLLEKKYSIDGKWTSLSANNKYLMADIIAMDSSIPLKSRGSMGKATGDIFKVGQEYALREEELTELDTLTATGQATEVVRRFFADTPKVITAVYERNEAVFQELLSTGIALVTSETDTVGTGVRIDAGIPTENKFDATLSWSNALATPVSDMRKVLDKAEVDGKRVLKFLMNRATFDKLKASAEGKALYAISVGNYGTTLQVPTSEMFINAFRSDFGAEIQIVERSVTRQRNGVDTTYKPWKDGAVTAITENKIGSLVWAKLAEMNHPVAGVAYTTADEYILVAKFRENRPSLAEITNSQARVCPVLDNVEAIYLLNTIVV